MKSSLSSSHSCSSVPSRHNRLWLLIQNTHCVSWLFTCWLGRRCWHTMACIWLLPSTWLRFKPWKSNKPYSVSSSSTKTEYRAYLETCEILWLIQILDHLRIPQNTPIWVLHNSQSSCALAHNSLHGRNKYIEVHYHFVYELIALRWSDWTIVPFEKVRLTSFTNHFKGHYWSAPYLISM